MPDSDKDPMVIIDAHLDLSWNALGWNRDLTKPWRRFASPKPACKTRAELRTRLHFQICAAAELVLR